MIVMGHRGKSRFQRWLLGSRFQARLELRADVP
jgi:nucleotide-binding universal stress UspA family protein